MRTGVAILCLSVLIESGSTGIVAADLARPHHRHHRSIVRMGRGLPPGYAYGGYGNGPGPGWVAADGPDYAPGITPGFGYIPAGAPPAILDLGY